MKKENQTFAQPNLFFVHQGDLLSQVITYQRYALRVSYLPSWRGIPMLLLTDPYSEQHLRGSSASADETVHLYVSERMLDHSFLQHCPSLKQLLRMAAHGVGWKPDVFADLELLMETIVGSRDEEQLMAVVKLFGRMAAIRPSMQLPCRGGQLQQKIFNRQKDIARLVAVDEYIHANIHRFFSTSDLAKELLMTVSSFSCWFHKKRNRRFVEYVNHIRLNYVKSELVATDRSINDIFFRYGFETPSNFRRLFYNETGMTPGEWRKQRKA